LLKVLIILIYRQTTLFRRVLEGYWQAQARDQ